VGRDDKENSGELSMEKRRNAIIIHKLKKFVKCYYALFSLFCQIAFDICADSV